MLNALFSVNLAERLDGIEVALIRVKFAGSPFKHKLVRAVTVSIQEGAGDLVDPENQLMWEQAGETTSSRGTDLTPSDEADATVVNIRVLEKIEEQEWVDLKTDDSVRKSHFRKQTDTATKRFRKSSLKLASLHR